MRRNDTPTNTAANAAPAIVQQYRLLLALFFVASCFSVSATATASKAAATASSSGPRRSVGVDLGGLGSLTVGGESGSDAEAWEERPRRLWSGEVIRKDQRRMSFGGDFDWGIVAAEGYPVLAGADNELAMKYDYTGTLSSTKNITMKLLQFDCETESDGSIAYAADYSNDGSIGVVADIEEDVIKDSAAHYKSFADETAARIRFCLRLDYEMVVNEETGERESISFLESKIIVYVGLVAGFTIENVAMERIGEDEAESEISCDVSAYYCDRSRNEISANPTFSQGDAIEICVVPLPAQLHCCVWDVREVGITQDKDGDGAVDARTDPVAGYATDPLTFKECGGGSCYIRSFLPSKFFSEPNPRSLKVDGMAVFTVCDRRPGYLRSTPAN